MSRALNGNLAHFGVFNRVNSPYQSCFEMDMKPAVFLDRDGTLIEEKEYLHRPEQVTIFPGAAAALKRLQDAGFLLFIVSNQSGVGRGFFTLADVENVHTHLQREFARE